MRRTGALSTPMQTAVTFSRALASSPPSSLSLSPLQTGLSKVDSARVIPRDALPDRRETGATNEEQAVVSSPSG